MKKIIIAKNLLQARKKAKVLFPKYYYYTVRKIAVNPNRYEFTLRKRQRRSYKRRYNKLIHSR